MTGQLTAVQAVAAVMADLPAVGKDSKSGDGGKFSYKYRGIDDVINALAGPMREHGLVLVPHVVECEVVPMVGRNGWTETRMTVEYDVCGPDGSTLPRPVRTFAIGADNGDKGPGKALSYAFKSAVSQLFAIPTDDPAMDNEAQPIPEPVPMINAEQRAEIRGLFAEVTVEGDRETLKAEWKAKFGELNLVTAEVAPVAIEAAVALVSEWETERNAAEHHAEVAPVHPDQGALLESEPA